MRKRLHYYPSLVPREVRWLDETLSRYNKACQFIAEYADEHEVYSVKQLRTADVRGMLLRKRASNLFNIQSGLVESAIRKVAADYASLNRGCRGKRREVVPDYQNNKLILGVSSSSGKSVSATISIVMPTVYAWHTSEFPMRLSIATYKATGGRLKVPFKKELGDVQEGTEWKKNRVLLMRTSQRWRVMCDVEVPDE
jgi:hypothetical protein